MRLRVPGHFPASSVAISSSHRQQEKSAKRKKQEQGRDYLQENTFNADQYNPRAAELDTVANDSAPHDERDNIHRFLTEKVPVDQAKSQPLKE
jgi:hypothetical protein